jgi:hypothetical protein
MEVRQRACSTERKHAGAFTHLFSMSPHGRMNSLQQGHEIRLRGLEDFQISGSPFHDANPIAGE